MHLDAVRILGEIPPRVGDEISKYLDSDETEREIAEMIVSRMNEGERWSVAVDAISREVAQRRRQRVRVIEQRTISTPSRHTVRRARAADEEREAQESTRVEIVQELGLPPETDFVSAMDAADRRHWEEVEREKAAVTAQLARKQMAFELTVELLDSAFTASPGVQVLWGDASIADHAARAASLYKTARGTVETAKLHEDAMSMIEDAGVTCLRELLRVSCAA